MPRALSARLTGYVLCSLIAGCGGTATDGPTSPAPAATDADSSAQENMTVDDPSADAAAPEASDGGLRDAIVANWVDTANDQRQIEFLSESSLMLSDEGGFTATFYDFVDDDTVRLADGSGEMDLSLKGETLAITFKRLGTPPFPYDDGQTATFTKAPQPPGGESAPQ